MISGPKKTKSTREGNKEFFTFVFELFEMGKFCNAKKKSGRKKQQGKQVTETKQNRVRQKEKKKKSGVSFKLGNKELIQFQ